MLENQGKKLEREIMRAQSTIEYLVIVAIIIVMALVVTTFMLSTSTNQDISKNSNELGSRFGSGSISVVEAITDADGDALFTFQSTSSEPIIITKISTGTIESSQNEVAIMGQQITVFLTDINADCPCPEGATTITCTYVLTYTQGTTTRTATVTKPTTCTTNTTPTNPGQVIGLGSGTLADPWIINSCAELQDMQEHLDGNYALGADINCSETNTWNSGAGFRPIGNNLGAALREDKSEKPKVLFFQKASFSGPTYSGTKFTGSLNGRGYVINNLYINRPEQSSQGLFGCLGTGSSVTRIGLVDYNIVGYQILGGIVGRNEAGTITKSYTSGTITGLAASTYAGGIVGYQIGATNIISNSYSTGTITGPSSVGGIAGWAHTGVISNTYSSANVSATATGAASYAGGIIGIQSSAVASNSFAVGVISAAGTPDYAGGIAGGASGVTSCYWDTSLTTQDTCYYASSDGCTSTANAASSYYGASGIPFATLGWSTEIWQANSGSYPTLK